MIKKDKKALFLLINGNTLSIKTKERDLFTIGLDQIETIKVERVINQEKKPSYEVNINGNFVELAKIQLQRTQAWKLKNWLERVIEHKKKYYTASIKEIRYRPHLFKPDWIDSFWQISTILIILCLLGYIVFFGIPGLNKGGRQDSDSKISYEYYFEEGKRLVDLDKLSEGINYLEDAKQIKNSMEVQNLLDAAYLERGEYYFQNNDIQKAAHDLRSIKKQNEKSKKILAKIEQINSPYGYILDQSVSSIQELIKTKRNLRWYKSKNNDTGLLDWNGKQFDAEKGIIFTCLISGANEEQILKIIFKTELMQKDISSSYPTFELLSQDFLGLFYQLPADKENGAKMKLWFNEWFPKVSTSNYQVKQQIADMRLMLMGGKGIRFLEISSSLQKKTP